MNRKEPRLIKNGYTVTLRWHDAVWAAAIGMLFVVCLEMFYRMIINYNDKYMSDMHFYVITNAQEGVEHDRLLGFLFTYFYRINENIMTAALQHLISKLILASDLGCCQSFRSDYPISYDFYIDNHSHSEQYI